MSRRSVAALAVALAAAAGSAAAYVRTSDKSTGVAISWPTPVVPFHVNLDALDASPTCRGGAGLAEVRAGFSEWEQDCTEFRYVYGGPISETATGAAGPRANLVVYRHGWCSQVAPAADPCWGAGDCDERFDCFDDGCPPGASSCANWGILAQTSVLYDPGTGRIFAADMELNAWDGVSAALPPPGTKPSHGWYFTCVDPSTVSTCASYGQGSCYYIDLGNTVTHEAGHFLGLAHPCGDPGQVACTDPVPAPPGWVPYADRTMYPYSSAGDVAKRTLSADDRAGVCDVYPKSSGGCGCGSETAAGTLSLLLAGLALKPRLRAGRRARLQASGSRLQASDGSDLPGASRPEPTTTRSV